MNPADEENLLTPEDEHGGSKDEIQNGEKSPSTVNERPAAKEQPPCISRDRKRPSSEKSATKKFRPRDGTQSQREDKEIKSIKGKIECSADYRSTSMMALARGPLDTMCGPILQLMKSLRV